MGRKAELAAAVKAAVEAAGVIAKRAEDENRDFTADEQAQIKGHLETAKAKKAEWARVNADEQVMSDLKALGDDLGLTDDPEQERKAPSGAIDRHSAKSLGAQFVESPQLKSLLASHNGRINDRASIAPDPVEVKDLLGIQRKALITGASATSGGPLIDPDYRGLQQGAELFQRPLTIRNLITVATTDSDTIEYARVTGWTNAASPVAESTTTADPGTMNAANGVKPESSLALEAVTTSVKTIAHWIPATKRALSDAGQLRALIDAFLLYGLDEELEDQIMTGDGTGQNFTGLLNTSGIQTQAWSTDILTTTMAARTKVRTVGRAVPTAFVLNPADFQTLALLQNNEGNYFFGGPMVVATPRLWGLPVVESEAITAGVGLVGDFRRAVLWDREQSSISVSDSHANFFIRNMVAILAELRAAFGVYQPTAFVSIDLTP